MALAATGRGSGTNSAGANPLNVSPSGNFAAGSAGVLCVTADNNSTGGATNDFAASMTDALGNLWTLRQAPIFDNGAAAAGIQGAIYTSSCSAGAPTTATTIPISTGVAATAKGWSLYEITKAANAEVAYVTGGVSTGATTGTPTVTTSSIPVGDLVVGAYHAEGVNATTGDSDTTNGSWAAQVTVTVGATTSGIRHSTQTKLQTTAAGAQTFNPTATSQDCILSWIQLHEQHTATAGVVLTGGGVVAAGASKQAKGAVALTGGGVDTTGAKTARNAGTLLTGGGVATLGRSTARSEGTGALTGGGGAAIAASGGRRSGVAATAGGALAWGYERSADTETHTGSFAMTGGGSMSTGASTTRKAGAALTGAGTLARAASTDRAGGTGLTAGGAVGYGAAKGARAGEALAGGGLATLGTASARLGAALLSGGGVLAEAGLTGRSTRAALTGGGAIAIAGTAEILPEDHIGGFALVGGGALALAAASARLAAVALTGGGSLDSAAAHAGSVSLLLAGGGSALAGWIGGHSGSWRATGGGQLIVAADGGTAPEPLPATVRATISGDAMFASVASRAAIHATIAPTADPGDAIEEIP